MKTTISIHSFRDAFQSLRPDDFTYDGLNALFDYLEEYEEGTDTELDLDVIALCCDFTEYSDLKEIQEVYSLTDIKTLDDLRDHTQVIEYDNGIIIQNF